MTHTEDSNMERVFVYGTLRQGQPNHWRLRGEFVGRGTVYGEMFSIGNGFPAAVFNSDGIIRGEVYEVDAECMKRLDILEGIDRGLYRKVRIAVHMGNGTFPVVWAYEGCESLIENASGKVPGGDWVEGRAESCRA